MSTVDDSDRKDNVDSSPLTERKASKPAPANGGSGMSFALWIAMGTAIGTATGNLAVGTALGAAMGAVFASRNRSPSC